jgi:hypothetical protein
MERDQSGMENRRAGRVRFMRVEGRPEASTLTPAAPPRATAAQPKENNDGPANTDGGILGISGTTRSN